MITKGSAKELTSELGSCHCGKIRFRVTLPLDFLQSAELVDCNCSICTAKGYLHLILPKDRFELLSSETEVEQWLSLYTYNTHMAKHYFCKNCGCAPYYIARSNPEGVDVNVRCMVRAREMVQQMRLIQFDGQNWESSMKEDDKLKHMA